jgi:peroxiredoxin
LSIHKYLPVMSILILCLSIALLFSSCSEGENPGEPGEKGATSNDSSAEAQLKECPQEGCLAPGFTVPDMTGRPVSLSDFKGKVVLLNIWATWCGPCKREIPSLDRLYQLRKDRGFEIVAVSVDRTSTSGVASFVAQHQMTFSVLHDTKGEVGRKYWARAIPSSFLLDKRGVIRWKVAGSINWDDPHVLSKVDELLSQ